MSRGVFIAGTDTEIGKTHAACAVLHALRAGGMRATGMKPVASGCQMTVDGLRNEDALALIAASDPRPVYADCNPFAFAEAVSPHIAASAHGQTVSMGPIESAFARLAQAADTVVVEGVGGWMAPLAPDLAASAMPRALGLPVILVVGLKLGCLNHASLTARAIADDGCRLLGWIGNRIDPDMQRSEENLDTLGQMLPVPCLGTLPHDPSAATGAAELDKVVALMRQGTGG